MSLYPALTTKSFSTPRDWDSMLITSSHIGGNSRTVACTVASFVAQTCFVNTGVIICLWWNNRVTGGKVLVRHEHSTSYIEKWDRPRINFVFIMIIGPRSPIRSVIIPVINKIGRPLSGSPICWSRVWLQLELDDKKSCYRWIKTVTKFEKETRNGVYVFRKKQQQQLTGEMRDNSARTLRLHKYDISIVPLTALLHCPITSRTRSLSYNTVQL